MLHASLGYYTLENADILFDRLALPVVVVSLIYIGSLVSVLDRCYMSSLLVNFTTRSRFHLAFAHVQASVFTEMQTAL